MILSTYIAARIHGDCCTATSVLSCSWPASLVSACGNSDTWGRRKTIICPTCLSFWTTLITTGVWPIGFASQVNVVQVSFRGGVICSRFILIKLGDSNRCKNPDDSNHDQQLYQGKTPFSFFNPAWTETHTSPSSWQNFSQGFLFQEFLSFRIQETNCKYSSIVMVRLRIYISQMRFRCRPRDTQRLRNLRIAGSWRNQL